MAQMLRPPSKLPVEGRFPSVAGATAWLNSRPLDPDGLQGKVVVVDFCTYTCINWLRTLSYVRAWAEKYRGLGLVVIGAHTPEFSFESDIDNVRQALMAMAVEYPVAVDNEYSIWDAFANHYWLCTSSIRPGGSGITSSGRLTTSDRRGWSSSFSPQPAPVMSTTRSLP